MIAALISSTYYRSSILYNCLLQLAKEQPGSHFLLLVNNDFYAQENLPANVEMSRVNLAPKNAITLHYWYNFKLPSLLKKYKVSCFLTEGNILSLRADIPQFLLVNDLSFLHRKPVLVQEHAGYIKRNFHKFLQKASGIFVTETFLKETLLVRYPAIKEKLSVAGHGLDEAFRPISWDQKESILETFSGGTEFFIAECSRLTQANVFSLVKAFSLFKKRQKSDMQLVLLLKELTIEECVRDFHLYKYRADVKTIAYTNDSRYAEMLGAAYASIYLPAEPVAENAGLNALKSAIPLITFNNAAAAGMYGEAALYTGPSEKEIAENMMLLYKDESLRKTLIEKGVWVSEAYNWVSSAKMIGQAISVCSDIKS